MPKLNGESTRGLAETIANDQYAGYAYAYPHKTSYRELDPPVELSTAWANEDKSRLYLYVHLPFCEMRCGFCNLFTASQPADELVDRTLKAITRQSRVVAESVEPQSVAQVAIGGGTPTYLHADELDDVLQTIRRDWPLPTASFPFSIEVSPATVDPNKLRVLIDHGVRRISMGVQSFVQRDLNRLGRPQQNHQVDSAIDLIRQSGVEVFNLDLIYGNHDQSEADWVRTVRRALAYRPEELFMYPLYVRELTGLGRTGRSPAENRRHLYGRGREMLLEAGYRQISMRMFRRDDVEYSTQHCCQEDGMIGLGPGARSYTSDLHYSSEYAVSGVGVRKIIADYCQRKTADFSAADYGVWLCRDEQARRYLIRSLLQTDGLDRSAFLENFGRDVRNMLPQVDELVRLDFAKITSQRLTLTVNGLAHSDVIGPWLYSDQVQEQMEQYELK
ncbi:Oxygen-independent coproporphyrinogen-III oxidase 1 [Stieleria neptunia]|uniref:Oxygen-independent coproporphyrinogen-III oxidase 1 n=1 Tax=Stieleria neptunia TaxID=2527979 RepID=A0A518HUL4_9BACT|nr:STM4012 family radical SAM protein [Stieleria neptunia]QDV44497.1 Oxygen-independent coproporphyrinogen-III oxidase 1 [Stieleria neptunia]